MLQPLAAPATRRGLLLVAGLAFAVAVASATAGSSWAAAARGMGLGLAAVVGLAQTCSA